MYSVIVYYFHQPLGHLFNSTTISLSRVGGKNLSMTPVFDDDVQRIDGLAAAKDFEERFLLRDLIIASTSVPPFNRSCTK